MMNEVGKQACACIDGVCIKGHLKYGFACRREILPVAKYGKCVDCLNSDGCGGQCERIPRPLYHPLTRAQAVHNAIADQRPEWVEPVKMTLPIDSEARKGIPVLSGCINYFAAALAGVARWSKIGNDKHNPGQPLHHARGKSADHGDCIVRHLMDIQDLLKVIDGGGTSSAVIKQLLDDTDALCWRSLALSQELHEKYAGAPMAPAAKVA